MIFWSTLHIYIQKCKAFFLLHVFGILTFFNVCYHSWKRSHGNLFYFKYAYLKEHISASEKIQSFEHRVILPLKHCIRRKSLTLVNYISWSHDAWYVAWQLESNLLVLKKSFQNIYFLTCDLLGISAYFNQKTPGNCIFCDFEAWSLPVPMRSHALFKYFYTSITRT